MKTPGKRNRKTNANQVLRVSTTTRAKINRIKQIKPAWSIMAIADEAVDRLMMDLGLNTNN